MKIGIQELIIVFIVALVVIGPDKLPEYAKKFGEALAQFRKYSDAATKDIRSNIVEPLEEAQRPLKEALEPVTDLEKTVRGNVNDIKKSLTGIGKQSSKADAPKNSGAGSDTASDLAEAPAASIPGTPDQPVANADAIAAAAEPVSSADTVAAAVEQASGTEAIAATVEQASGADTVAAAVEQASGTGAVVASAEQISGTENVAGQPSGTGAAAAAAEYTSGTDTDPGSESVPPETSKEPA